MIDHAAAMLAAQADIEQIVSDYPALRARLVPPAGGGTVRVSGTKDIALPIVLHVVEIEKECDLFAHYLARVLLEETDWTLPRDRSTPGILADIAHRRIGHFTESSDEQVRLAFYDEANRLRRRVHNAAYPTGARTTTVRDPAVKGRPALQCIEFVDGQPCEGVYRIHSNPARPDSTPGFRCSADRKHVIDYQLWNIAAGMAGRRGTSVRSELARGTVREGDATRPSRSPP